MLKYLNKGVSAPIAIAIILIVSVIAGGFIYIQISKQQTPLSEIKISEKDKEVKDETALNEKACSTDPNFNLNDKTIEICLDIKSFDLDNKTFEGTILPENKKIKVITTDSTKFYIGAYVSEEKFVIDDCYTFSEFYSLRKEWAGQCICYANGIYGENNTFTLNEISAIAQ